MVDLTLTLEDNMPAYKLFQRPVVVPHLTHEQTKSFNLGVPEDRLTFATTFIGTIDHIATHVDASYHVNHVGVSRSRRHVFRTCRSHRHFTPTCRCLVWTRVWPTSLPIMGGTSRPAPPACPDPAGEMHRTDGIRIRAVRRAIS